MMWWKNGTEDDLRELTTMRGVDHLDQSLPSENKSQKLMVGKDKPQIIGETAKCGQITSKIPKTRVQSKRAVD